MANKVKLKEIVFLISAFCTIIPAIFYSIYFFKDFGIKIHLDNGFYLLAFLVIYIAIILIAISTQSNYNFMPTTALRFRFLFAFVLIVYAFTAGVARNNVVGIRILIFIYLIYCLILTFWMLKPDYAGKREIRTIFDIVLTCAFCFFLGDPYWVFLFGMFIPVTVISRSYKTNEMFVWITLAIACYIGFNILHLHFISNITTLRGVALNLSAESAELIDYIKMFYLEVLIICLTAFIFWAERKKNEFINRSIDKIHEKIEQKVNIDEILEVLCKMLKIQVGIVAWYNGDSFHIIKEYSLKSGGTLRNEKILDLAEAPILKNILTSIGDFFKAEDGCNPNLKAEMIRTNLVQEKELKKSQHFTYMCINIPKVEKQYYLLLFNKLTVNQSVVRMFSEDDINIIKRIVPLLHNCLE